MTIIEEKDWKFQCKLCRKKWVISETMPLERLFDYYFIDAENTENDRYIVLCCDCEVKYRNKGINDVMDRDRIMRLINK